MVSRFSPNYYLSDLPMFLCPANSQAKKTLGEAFCERTGHRNAVSFRYGRSGLYYLLKAMGANNKKVIMPAYTCVVVAHAVTLSGNIPVFIDSAENSFQPDTKAYLTAIDDDTVMVIPTNLFGIAEETATLYKEIKIINPNIFVLQDCAHSFFCKDRRGQVVTTYGDGALFGMNISKLVNSVHGGMLTLNDSGLASEINRLRDEHFNMGWSTLASLRARLYCIASIFAFTTYGYELVWWLRKKTKLLDSEAVYYHENLIDLPADFNQPLTNFEATVGLRSLDRLNERIKRRRQIAEDYEHLLKPEVKMGVISVAPWQEGNTWSHYPVELLNGHRDKVVFELERKLRVEIGTVIDYVVPKMSAYSRIHGSHGFTRSTNLSLRVINLPLTNKIPAVKVVEVLKEILKEYT